MEEKMDLAYDIDLFEYDFNPFQYNDRVGNREEHVNSLYRRICSHNNGIRNWLQGIVDGNPGSRDAATAAKLIKRLSRI